MRVKLVTPNRVEVHEDFDKVIAEGTHGSFCVLPRHIDYLAILTPGILELRNATLPNDRWFAVDRGLLIKQADEISIAVHQAIESSDLETLQTSVAHRFQRIESVETAGMTAVASLEANFVRRLLELHKENA